MKRVLVIILLAVTAFTAYAQSRLTLVMNYRWVFDAKGEELRTEGKCEDVIEFDFDINKAVYHQPAGEITEILSKITKVGEPTVDKEGVTTYEFVLFEMGSERQVSCVLTASSDLKKIQMTMISQGREAIVYNVADMLTEE